MKNKIRVLRAEKKISQEELAERTGVTRQTILAIEKDKYSPSLQLALKICSVFNKKIEEVFYEYEDKN